MATNICHKQPQAEEKRRDSDRKRERERTVCGGRAGPCETFFGGEFAWSLLEQQCTRVWRSALLRSTGIERESTVGEWVWNAAVASHVQVFTSTLPPFSLTLFEL